MRWSSSSNNKQKRGNTLLRLGVPNGNHRLSKIIVWLLTPSYSLGHPAVKAEEHGDTRDFSCVKGGVAMLKCLRGLSSITKLRSIVFLATKLSSRWRVTGAALLGGGIHNPEFSSVESSSSYSLKFEKQNANSLRKSTQNQDWQISLG